MLFTVLRRMHDFEHEFIFISTKFGAQISRTGKSFIYSLSTLSIRLNFILGKLFSRNEHYFIGYSILVHRRGELLEYRG